MASETGTGGGGSNMEKALASAKSSDKTGSELWMTSESKFLKRSSNYPEPLVFSPLEVHKHTIILLHGRGSSATKFGEELLATLLPNGQTLQGALPNAKFVFPTASKRRSTVLKRVPINQWFDNFSLEDPNIKQHLQIDGLRETTRFVHDLVKKEIDSMGGENVVLGGLSQGCAASLFALLMLRFKLAGFIGMSGWLPFEDVLQPENDVSIEFSTLTIGSEEIDNKNDIDTTNRRLDRTSKALEQLREQTGFSNEKQADTRECKAFKGLETPIFLGHGADDLRVASKLSERASECLRQLGGNVSVRVYKELGHWYSCEELQEAVEFLKAQWHTETP